MAGSMLLTSSVYALVHHPLYAVRKFECHVRLHSSTQLARTRTATARVRVRIALLCKVGELQKGMRATNQVRSAATHTRTHTGARGKRSQVEM